MQEQINKIDKVVVGIKKDVEYIKGSQEEQKETMKAFIKDAPNLFASKLSEKIVYGLVGVMVLAVVSALVASVVSALDYFLIM